MTTDSATLDIADAIRAAFISTQADDHGRPVNIVDAIDAVARSLWSINVEGLPQSAGMIAEAINTVGGAMASALSDLADAVHEQNS